VPDPVPGLDTDLLCQLIEVLLTPVGLTVTLVGPDFPLVGHPVTLISQGVPLVGHPVTLIGPDFPLVGHPVTLVSPGFPLVGLTVTLVGPGLVFAGWGAAQVNGGRLPSAVLSGAAHNSRMHPSLAPGQRPRRLSAGRWRSPARRAAAPPACWVSRLDLPSSR
jgi:hypothetical protein